MNRYQGVIFDLDGVICFTDQFHYQAWEILAKEYGIPFDETVNHRIRGVSRRESLEIILENYSGRLLSEEERLLMMEKKNQIYQDLLMQMTPGDLADETKQTLDKLRKRGVLLAIGSSSKNAKLILEKIGLKDYFDAVSDGTNITRSKPDPEVFLKAAEMVGLKAEECLVVEDSEAGLEAAVRGGFDSAGIQEARNSKLAVWSIRQFSELLDIVERT